MPASADHSSMKRSPPLLPDRAHCRYGNSSSGDMLSETVVSVLIIYRLPVLSIETSNYEFRNAGSVSSQPPIYRKFPIIRLAVLDAR